MALRAKKLTVVVAASSVGNVSSRLGTLGGTLSKSSCKACNAVFEGTTGNGNAEDGTCNGRWGCVEANALVGKESVMLVAARRCTAALASSVIEDVAEAFEVSAVIVAATGEESPVESGKGGN